LIDPYGDAIAKWNDPLVPPTTFSLVVTVTVSPGVNGRLGRKLPPRPSESAAILPVCAPDLEPATRTEPICPARIPLKVICVCGSAVVVFGLGNTLTCGGLASAFPARRTEDNAAMTSTISPLLIADHRAVRRVERCCNLSIKPAPTPNVALRKVTCQRGQKANAGQLA
jgi:hypothetical protein